MSALPDAQTPARNMTREQALNHLLHLRDSEHLEVAVLDADHAGDVARLVPHGVDGPYGHWPDVRVVLCSPCKGILLTNNAQRGWRWGRMEIDPRLAVGVVRLCDWLRQQGVICINAGFGLGRQATLHRRRLGAHDYGDCLDLSHLTFSAQASREHFGGQDHLQIDDAAQYPRYLFHYFRGGGHQQAPFTGTQRHTMPGPQAHQDHGHLYDDWLVRATGVPPEASLFDESQRGGADPFQFCTSPNASSSPFLAFIRGLLAEIQKDFCVNEAYDEGDRGQAPVWHDQFFRLVSPNHQSLGNHGLGTGRSAHFNHIHMQVPEAPLPHPSLPSPESGPGADPGPSS